MPPYSKTKPYLLEHLNLHVNEPEPTIICRTCQFSLNGINSLVGHAVEKHKLPRHLAKEASRRLGPYTILGPKELRLRPDNSAPHPYLSKHLGAMCKHCGLKTTSTEVLSRHLSKDHRMKRKTSTWRREHVIDGLMLQSWDRNGAYGYWTVAELDRSVPISSSFDNSLLQQSVPRMQRLEQLHRDELGRIRGHLKESNIDTSSSDMALNTNWMRRTQWAETFAGADRKLLVQLAQIPPVYSHKEDEFKLRHIVTALDRVFDRCEDTVRHTDVSIRCLLRSSYPDRTYKAPFELVGRKATTEGYRRLFKKAVCFCVRFWRLGRSARQNLLRRSLTDAQDQSLKRLWSKSKGHIYAEPSQSLLL
ncbi:hypothetical protein GQ44DRAFT_744804 [Phaeosphaeriaceae sp. PMI808]|nr:hypothetical protein GQ44DRAFT_744804 [Phaeosphaeriaceae sp. PMI808]